MMWFEIVRYGVFGVVVLACGAAAGSWALRTRRINPFGKPGQLIRRTTDPILNPIENWIHRRGGNPQNAEGWLAAGSVVGGIVVIGIATGIADLVTQFAVASRQGTSLFRFIIVLAARVLSAAIFIRAIGSWFGLHRYTPYARPLFTMTDWIIEPLRRWIPPLGNIDVTPFVAFLLVQVVIQLIR